ncbi:hypothetical protein, partial [Arthrobacter sp. H5]|uniref:hypothetical protein n=1 Tax=Arthrobacter sp. H5 TaxID=1267973 RepID=UPI001C1E12BD
FTALGMRPVPPLPSSNCTIHQDGQALNDYCHNCTRAHAVRLRTVRKLGLLPRDYYDPALIDELEAFLRQHREAD